MKKLIILFFISFSLKTKSQVRYDSTYINFTKEWIGTPYKFGGKTKKGIDCSSFNKMFYEEVYKVQIQNICKEQYKQSKRISLNDLIFGDIVFFYSKSSPSKWHCGIYLGDNKFIHSSSSKRGVNISDLNEGNYLKRFKSGGRIL